MNPTSASLQAQIDTVMNAMVPTEMRRTIATMVNHLRDANRVPGIEIGAPAPQFVLPDATGIPVALSDRFARGPVVLKFYRGAWCPVCNIDLRAMQSALPEIHAAGASLIAVSPQAPDHSLNFAEKLELTFDVLSDLDQHVAQQYQIRFELDGAVRDLYTDLELALPDLNADHTWNLPVPATFVIDRDGIVRSRHVDADYQQRMEPTAIIDALRAL